MPLMDRLIVNLMKVFNLPVRMEQGCLLAHLLHLLPSTNNACMGIIDVLVQIQTELSSLK